MAIKITIEMWPYGFKQFKYTLGEAVIHNNNTGDKEIGNYEGYFQTYYRDEAKHIAKTGCFNRSDNVWELLKHMLNSRTKLPDSEHFRKDIKSYLKKDDEK